MPSLHNPFFDHVSQILERETRDYVTLHGRPRVVSDNFSLPDVDPPQGIAIIIQGPILADHDFTLETVRLYCKIFPFARVVLSTWGDQSEDLLTPFFDIGIEVVLCEKPPFPGLQNINFQIASTSSGIFRAEEIGSTFVVKTRSDIRIYSPDFFLHALDLMAAFPLSAPVCEGQDGRLVSVGEGGKYAFMVIPDRIMFGFLSDMKSYWRVPFDDRDAPSSFGSLLEMAQFGVSESYLAKIFCARKGIPFEASLDFYWGILRDYFVFMDQSSADVYWCKHNRAREFRNLHYFGPSSFDSFGFKEWLRVYRGIFPLNSDSRIVLRQHGALLSDLF